MLYVAFKITDILFKFSSHKMHVGGTVYVLAKVDVSIKKLC
jgi:hypothetical protein